MNIKLLVKSAFRDVAADLFEREKLGDESMAWFVCLAER